MSSMGATTVLLAEDATNTSVTGTPGLGGIIPLLGGFMSTADDPRLSAPYLLTVNSGGLLAFNGTSVSRREVAFGSWLHCWEPVHI